MGEIIIMSVPFNNTIVSGEKLLSSINYADLESDSLQQLCNKQIKGFIETPEELKNHIEFIDTSIDLLDVVEISNEYFVFDCECEITFKVLSSDEEAKNHIQDFQDKKGDMRWLASIYWEGKDKETYLFDGWDELSISESIEDIKEWYL